MTVNTHDKQHFIDVALWLLWSVVSRDSQHLLHAFDVNKRSRCVGSCRPEIQRRCFCLQLRTNGQSTVVKLLRRKRHESLMLTYMHIHITTVLHQIKSWFPRMFKFSWFTILYFSTVVTAGYNQKVETGLLMNGCKSVRLGKVFKSLWW